AEDGPGRAPRAESSESRELAAREAETEGHRRRARKRGEATRARGEPARCREVVARAHLGSVRHVRPSAHEVEETDDAVPGTARRQLAVQFDLIFREVRVESHRGPRPKP